MREIVLTTFNARYAHAAFGLRYLQANLPADLQARSQVMEFDVSRRAVEAVEAVLREQPRIVGLGVYVWNVQASLQFAGILKRIAPQVTLVLGGPEVSHETEAQPIVALADYVIKGEGDLTLGELCEKLLRGERPLLKVMEGRLPTMRELTLPYDLYTERDLAQRVVYVEASRGCPFSCEFCLSSLEVPVRDVPLETFLGAMGKLLDRGLQRFKFVDRTFNLNLRTSRGILEFFLERLTPGLFLHFEMVPDRLPEALREVIARFPPGVLQFEVGVQTFNAEVAALISRQQNYGKLEENLRWLREKTGVHVHADLIMGLPGEDVASFAAGFDRLVQLGPHEIQLELLKRLRGTPMARHEETWGLLYEPDAPYEILQTKLISFEQMQILKRFARAWDLIANSGNFRGTTPLLWRAPGGAELGEESAFAGFNRFAQWLFARTGQTHGISLSHLVEHVFTYLISQQGWDAKEVARQLWADYQRGGRSDVPGCMKRYLSEDDLKCKESARVDRPARQARHWSAL